MEQQNRPRSINLNQARGSSGAQTPAGQSRYGQAANTQRNPAASGQVRRTAPQDPRTAPQTRQAPQRRTPQNPYAAAPSASARAQQAPSSAQRGARQPVQQQAPYAGQRRTAQPAQSRAPQQSAYAQQRRAQQQPPSQQSARQRSSAPAGTPRSTQKNSRAAKKKKTMNRFLITLSSVFAVLLVAYIGVQVWGGSFLNEGEMGGLNQVIATPPQFRSEQLNLLLVGIDYTTEDGQPLARDPIGQTDMIMYVRFDFKENSMKMLQIPRDFFVGEQLPTGGSGRINAIFKHSEDKENRVNTLSEYIYEHFQLPVDAYATIDMESLREIVDLFGGIEVYVSRDLSFKGSELSQGLHTLTGVETEFFLRNRTGDGYATGDIARLDMQRYFYSGLFRRVRTATWKDIVKLMPVVNKYINTSLSLNDSMGLAIKMLKIPSSNIMMCKMSTFDSAENYKTQAVQIGNAEGIAEVLNTYFRTPEDPITPAEMNLADWPHASMAHEANVQWMKDVDEASGQVAGEAADDTQTGDDLLNPGSTAQSGSAAQPAA